MRHWIFAWIGFGMVGVASMGAGVGQEKVSVRLIASSNVQVGQEVTFLATVEGDKVVPTGKVEFMEGGKKLGEAVLDGTGKGMIRVPGMEYRVENHVVTAVYGGDGRHETGTSRELRLVINAPQARTGEKEVFDAMAYDDADGKRHVTGLPILYYTAWKDKEHLQAHAKYVASLKGKYFALDIEDEKMPSNQEIVQMIGWVKAAVPGMKVGVYGWPMAQWYAASNHLGKQAWKSGTLGPVAEEVSRTYKQIDEADSEAEWKKVAAKNDAFKEVMDVCDYACPDVYTHFDMKSSPLVMVQWGYLVDAGVSEAKRLMPGKPVYCWMQPEYTPDAGPLAGKAEPAEFFKKQWEYVMERSDGVIIFSTKLPWESNLQWQEAVNGEVGKRVGR